MWKILQLFSCQKYNSILKSHCRLEQNWVNLDTELTLSIRWDASFCPSPNPKEKTNKRLKKKIEEKFTHKSRNWIALTKLSACHPSKQTTHTNRDVNQASYLHPNPTPKVQKLSHSHVKPTSRQGRADSEFGWGGLFCLCLRRVFENNF